MERFGRFFMIIAAAYLGVCLVLFPQEGISTGVNALNLCFNSVAPALFPYLVCSGLLSSLGAAKLFSHYLSPLMRPLFGVPGCGAIALVLGTVSGYPIGAVCANDLYLSGECTKTEAERLLAFCNNSGPLFVISVIGGAFLESPHLGRILYISHALSAVLTGIIFRAVGKNTTALPPRLPAKSAPEIKNTFRALGEVMDSSVFTILKICGFVVFFTVFASSLPSTAFSPYIHSLLEITGGLKKLATLDIEITLKLSLISFFVAFSGISVMFQVAAITARSGLSLKMYFGGKLLQGCLSFVITKILVSRFPALVDVFAKSAASTATLPSYSAFISSVCMMFLGLMILFLMLKAAHIGRRR